MDPTRTLIELSYSPWSERARWALDHHHLTYRRIFHEPVIGERKLRRLVGPRPGRYTVPVLLTGEQVLMESWDIASYADRVGASTPLISKASEATVRDWVDRADRAMAAARALFTLRLLGSGPARDETLPRAVPRPLRPLSRPFTWLGVRWFAQKYALTAYRPESALTLVRTFLDDVRAALTRGDYLLGSFGYADIVACGTLQAVSPVADEYIRLGPASRAIWTDAALLADYADLVAWRDRLYARHRRTPR